MTTIKGIKCNKGGGSKLVGKVGQFWAGIFTIISLLNVINHNGAGLTNVITSMNLEESVSR